MNTKTLEEYLKQKYPITLVKEEDCIFIEIKDLPGCMSQGDTLEEAYRMIDDARCLWIETAFKGGIPIPEPKEAE